MPGSQLTPEQRAMRARLASHTSWARTSDPAARTANARKGLLERFEREVDPGGVLEPTERARRAEHLRLAHYTRLALKSAQSRRKGRELLAGADAADAGPAA